MKRPRASSAWQPITLLFIAGAIAVVYGFPGYMNYDSADQLRQARFGSYIDWHAPAMAWYWHYIDRVVRGPLPLLLLQIGLFLTGAYRLFERRMSRQSAALAAGALLLFPPVLAVMAVVWKDSQMAAWLICGFALALDDSWRTRAIGLMMLVLAAAVRDNGLAPLPPIMLVVAAAWGVRGRLRICAAALGLFVAVVGMAFALDHVVIKSKHGYAWTQANAIHDIGGTICLAEPMTDDEVRAELVGIKLRVADHLQQRFCEQYMPRWWFPLSFNDRGLFVGETDEAERAARTDAWWRVIRDHPAAFAKHRWKVTHELLGFTAVPDEPVCQTFAGQPDQLKHINHDASLSYVQHVLGHAFLWLAGTVLFRPWGYLLIGLILAGYSAWKRDGLLVAMIASGVLCEASYVLGAAGAPYRYSHWLVTCACFAVILVAHDRWIAGRER